ncbi:MAG TPA: CoA-binding protein [Nevskiaceae bacterium]|nr:CoA-binding protein [Nevskiaceae bacterium]
MNRHLKALFNPASVAIVGASNDTRKYGNWLSVQALRGEHRRVVHLVNRKGEAVLGHATVKSLADIAGGAELVVIATPAASFEQTIDDALQAGARAIVGVTAGFAELGPEGKAVQDRVAKRVRASGAVLLGPNCLGMLDSTSELSLAITNMPAGGVSLLSQSGNMAIELGEFLAARGLGFARFASLGNQADLCAADLIRDCATHEGTKLIALYCEDFRDGRDFVAAATEARRNGKPVVLLTVGGSAASIRGAKSHTGALTSGTAVVDAACRAAGIYRVSSLRELADVAAVLLNFGMRPVKSVAIFADGGGHAGVGSDIVEAAGLTVPEFSAVTQGALKAELPPSAGVVNPIDLAGAGDHDVSVFGRVLDITLKDPKVDAVLVTGGYGVYSDYGEEMARSEDATAVHMAQSAKVAGKPLLVHTMWPARKACKVLAEQGVPVFRAVEDAARALSVVSRGRGCRAGAERRVPHE